MNRLVAGAALAALLLGACSSSGSGAKQPEDEFLDQVEAVCREASTKIHKVTAGPDAPGELLTIVSDAADSLNNLTPPSSLGKDFDKYTSKLDEETSALGDVADAIAGGDADAERTSLNNLNTASNDADRLVNSLGAIRCRGLIPFDALTDVDSGTITTGDTTVETADTSGTTEISVETTPPTEVTETTPPLNTPLPIDTIPPTEATPPPPGTSTPPEILPSDLTVEAVAPDGYQWIPFQPEDASGLYSNSVIGDLVVGYAAGEFQSIADPSITASVYVVTLSTPFTPEYVKAYQFWEAVDHGTDVMTPGGVTVHEEIGAFSGLDCAVYTGTTRGMALCGFTGTDLLTIIDQYLAANPF